MLKSSLNDSTEVYQLKIDCGDLYLRENVSFDDDCDYCFDILKLDLSDSNEELETLEVHMNYTVPYKKLNNYEKGDNDHLFRVDILKFNQTDKTFYICENFWTGYEQICKKIIKNLKNLEKIYFTGRHFLDNDGTSLADIDDDEFIRKQLNNPKWEDEVMLDPAEDKDDLDQLIALRKEINPKIDLEFSALSDVSEKILKDKAIIK